MADLIPTEGLENLLNLVVASGNPIKCRLFKNDVAGDVDTTLAGLTECDFSGYAAQDVTPLSPPVDAGDGVVRSQVITVTFGHNGGPVTNQAFGYYLTVETMAGSQLLWVGRDEAYPVTFAGVGDVIAVDVLLLATQEV